MIVNKYSSHLHYRLILEGIERGIVPPQIQSYITKINPRRN
ncbi:hypothetical protein J5U23_01662 [Saccharolobus shibatae B12]|uniref:Uncharacterized protein n=1 Tax=Saccharolobus shibatae (strain ATCC 51178 / DSM 5389 / JCM 8931 / NBRC 15437 / B12) TaxID=523848 RepID=A0A8F5BPA9_SACSH|nr:hypothetical protein J5U23_01662 [Saccharolobus shibatae B12]